MRSGPPSVELAINHLFMDVININFEISMADIRRNNKSKKVILKNHYRLIRRKQGRVRRRSEELDPMHFSLLSKMNSVTLWILAALVLGACGFEDVQVVADSIKSAVGGSRTSCLQRLSRRGSKLL